MTGETASDSKQGTDMNKRKLDRQDTQARVERKLSVEQRQKDIALAYIAKDTAAVNRLQRGRIRSLDCRVIAVMDVASNRGGRTAGMDGDYPSYPKLNAWDRGRRKYHPYTSKPEERITLL